jgi:putative membrane protein
MMWWPYAYGPGPGWGAMVFGWLWMLVFVAAVVAVVVWITRAATAGHADTALQVLRRRYAAGDLTKEQYERMKQDLAA